MTKKVSRVEKRWEDGVDHDPRSEEIFFAIRKIDEQENGGALDLKAGGDGDIGESLMFLLDVYFEDKDKSETTKKEHQPLTKEEIASGKKHFGRLSVPWVEGCKCGWCVARYEVFADAMQKRPT